MTAIISDYLVIILFCCLFVWGVCVFLLFIYDADDVVTISIYYYCSHLNKCKTREDFQLCLCHDVIKLVIASCTMGHGAVSLLIIC